MEFIASVMQVVAKYAYAIAAVVLIGILTTAVVTLGPKVSAMLSSSQTSNLSLYDNKDVDGQTVVNAINSVKSIGGSVKLSVTVKTKQNPAGVVYGYATSATTTPVQYTNSDPNDSDYINANGSFKSTLTTSNNGITTGITFVQE